MSARIDPGTNPRLDTTSTSLSTALHVRGEHIDRVDDKLVVDIVCNLIRESADQKERFWVPRWLQSLYFAMGHQHIFWSTNRKRWFPMLVTSDKRITVNLVKSRWLTDAAKLIKAQPNFEVIPAFADAEAADQARTALKIMRYLFRVSKVKQQELLGAQHRALFGGVFWRTEWDDQAHIFPKVPQVAVGMDGEPIINPETGEPVVLVDGQGRVKTAKPKPEGDVRVRLISVFDMHAPVGAVTPFPRDWAWAAERLAVPVGDIEARYNIRVKPEKRAIDVTAQIGLDLGRYFSRGTSLFGEQRGSDSAWVIDYHEPPSTVPGFEQGRRIVIAADHLVENDIAQLPSRKVPYHHMPTIPVPMQPWGDCFIPEMLEPQMAYNTARGHIAKARSRVAHPHMIMESGSIAGDKVTADGRLLEVRAGSQWPTIPDLPGISSAIVSELQAARADIDSAGSQFAFARGEQIGKTPSPVGTVDLLQKADAGDLSFALGLGAEAMAGIGEDLLELARDKYTTKRIASMVGEGDDPEVFEFSRTDIAPNLNVIVQEGSDLPQNKEAIRAQLSELMKSGFFGPIQNDLAFVQHILELFEMPSPDLLTSLGALDTKLSRRESRRMLFGDSVAEVIPVNENDDHQAHITEIDRHTKGSYWSMIDEGRRQLLMQHRAMHVQALQVQQQQQMQQQLQLQQLQQGLAQEPPQE